MNLADAMLALALVGAAGGVHCVGMCGGIVAALAAAAPGPRVPWRLVAGYNAGRIASYMLAGAVAGGIGSVARYADAVLPAQRVLYVAASLALVAIGLYVAGLTRVLAPVERAGAAIWMHVQPLGTRLLPVRTFGGALLAGAAWGWVPCGLVYGALVTALAAGDAARGALLMGAFGIGTLPYLIAGAAAADRLRRLRTSVSARRLMGAAVALLGMWGIAAQAGGGGAIERVLALCFARG